MKIGKNNQSQRNEYKQINKSQNILKTTCYDHIIKLLISDYIFLYNPNVEILKMAFIKLLTRITREIHAIKRLVIIANEENEEKAQALKTSINNFKMIITMVKFSELSQVYSTIIEESSTLKTGLVFDNIIDEASMNIITKNSHTFTNNFAFILTLSTSAILFKDLCTGEKTQFVPVFFNFQSSIFNFYQNIINEAKLVTYEPLENELYTHLNNDQTQINIKISTLSRFINELQNGNISKDKFNGEIPKLKVLGNKLMFLLFNGLYDTTFISSAILQDKQYDYIKINLEELPHTSDKLTKFINLLREETGNKCAVVFKTSSLLEIVGLMLKHYFPNSRMIKTNRQSVNIEVMGEFGVLKTILLVENTLFNTLCTKFDDIIYFDYLEGVCFKKAVVLVSPKEKINLYEHIKAEEALRQLEPTNDLLFTSYTPFSPDKDLKLRFFATNVIDYALVLSVCHDNKFIVKQVNKNDHFLVLEKTNNFSYLATKLAYIGQFAVQVLGIKSAIENLSIMGESMCFGTITSFTTFNDPFEMGKVVYVFPRNDVIIIYCVTGTKLIKVKISSSCIEKYMFFDIRELLIDVYICLNRRPKVYVGEMSVSKSNRLKNIARTRERYDFFESIQWSRASLNEVPFIKNRNDVRIHINLRNNPDQLRIKEAISYMKKCSVENKDQESSFNSKKPKLYDLIDYVVQVFSRIPFTQVMFTSFSDQKLNTLSNEQIYDQFKNNDFSDYYYIVCLLSQKGRYFNYILDEEDCKIMKGNVKGAVLTLMGKVNTRFLDIKNILEKHKGLFRQINEEKNLMKHVTVTPLSIIYRFPTAFEGNRVLRAFAPEKFLKVSLREEDKVSKVKDSTVQNQNLIYDYYRSILTDGLFIGERKYFFLAMTMSQMRLHNAWFITPYFSKDVLIGPDYIRKWLGDFSSIKNIGKRAIRLGQPLSSTFATVNVPDFIEIEDVKNNGHVFSDGIGLISFTLAKEVSKHLNLSTIPSALQVRFAGFKGVVAVHPLLNEDKIYFKNPEFNSIRTKLLGNIESIKVDENPNNKRSKISDLLENSASLLMRPSMNKFTSSHRNLEVVAYSTSQPCYLNRQYIMLLEGLGVDLSVFLEKHDEFIINNLSDIYYNPTEYVKRHFGLFSSDFKLQESKIFKKLLMTILNKHLKEYYKKCKILIRKGGVLMGAFDELGVLEENEVFIKIKREGIEKNQGFMVEGEYFIVTGKVVIMKNPCLHPGDIRTVIAVDKPELRYLQDVLVFNQKGNRPLTNMCSGSDLDGDMYTIIWDSLLIPKEDFEPSEYKGSIVLNKDIVSTKDIINFYIRYIRNYHLGSIAHSHLVNCDLKSIKDDNSLLLADLFNKSIDFPKTGFMAMVPETLIPRRYPDFMESKVSSYPSFKSAGVLFRRGFDMESNRVIRCECRRCIERTVTRISGEIGPILGGCNILYKEIIDNSRTDEKTFELFNEYKKEISSVIEKHGYKKEELAFFNFTDENDEICTEILIDIKEVFTKYRNIIRSREIEQMGLLKLSEGCMENISSIVLLIQYQDELKNQFVYKSLHDKRKDESSFILNSMIKIEFIRNNIQKDSGKGKSFVPINVYVNEDLYNAFCKLVTKENEEILKEIFDLLFIGGFFRTNSFDLVCLFFNSFFSKITNKKIDKLTACKALLEMSRDFFSKATTVPYCHLINREIIQETEEKNLFYDIRANSRNVFNIHPSFNGNKDKVKVIIDYLSRLISTVASLLVLKIGFLEKVFQIKNFKKLNMNENVQDFNLNRKKIETYSHLSICGMFDAADELKLEPYEGPRNEMHSNKPLYCPRLLNKGYCDIDTYKDNIKEFFLNMFLEGIPDINETSNHLGIFYQIFITPGKFYLFNVDSSFVNSILTIDQMKSKVLFYKNEVVGENPMNHYFLNYSQIFDSSSRQEYFKSRGILFQGKSTEYILAFFKDNTRYQLYFSRENEKFKLFRVCRNKKIKGKAFLLNEKVRNIPDDVNFELSYEELIFNGTVDRYSPEESDMFKGEIIKIENGSYVVDKSLSSGKQFRFEINICASSKGGSPITLSNREVMTPGKNNLILDNKTKRVAVNYCITRIFENKKDLKLYLSDFEAVWNCYKAYYC